MGLHLHSWGTFWRAREMRHLGLRRPGRQRPRATVAEACRGGFEPVDRRPLARTRFAFCGARPRAAAVGGGADVRRPRGRRGGAAGGAAGPGRHGQPVRPQEAEPGHRARQGRPGESRAPGRRRGDLGQGCPAPGRACRSAGRASRSRVAAPDRGRRASRAPRRVRSGAARRSERGLAAAAVSERRAVSWSHLVGGRARARRWQVPSPTTRAGGPVPPGGPPRAPGPGAAAQPRRGVEVRGAPASPGSASLLGPLSALAGLPPPHSAVSAVLLLLFADSGELR